MRNHMHQHEHTQGHWGGGWHGFRGWGGHYPHHGRGKRHRPGHGQGRDWQDFFGSEGGWPWGRHFGGHGGFGGGRERLERGLLRYIILSVLQDGPRHGYEIIKQLEERTQGRYSPSPGTLYPTLQYLEDLGLVRSDQETDKRVYHLTDSGRAELDKQHSMVEGFWARFQDRARSGPNLYELKFAGDALKDLLRTLGSGLHSGAFSDNPDTVRKVRQALERCQNEIREIIAQGATAKTSSNDAEAPRPGPSGSTEESYL
jgi:DNA-binding PadR family transcriptional regulator